MEQEPGALLSGTVQVPPVLCRPQMRVAPGCTLLHSAHRVSPRGWGVGGGGSVGDARSSSQGRRAPWNRAMAGPYAVQVLRSQRNAVRYLIPEVPGAGASPPPIGRPHSDPHGVWQRWGPHIGCCCRGDRLPVGSLG